MAGGICNVLTDEVEFKWEIQQFRKVRIHMESASERCLSSTIRSNKFSTKIPLFDLDIKYWQLKLEYLKNSGYKIVISEYYTSVYELVVDSVATTISVEFFTLNNKQEKVRLNDIAKVHFSDKNDFYSSVISPNILNNDKFVFNDTLTIICNLVEYGKPTTRPYPPLEDVTEILLKNIKNLLTSEQYSDMTLIVAESEFKVHKIILAALSPVFAAMFSYKDLEESHTHQVVIKDTNAETMKKFLEFIYSGKIEQLNQEKFDLWILADKYQIEALKNYCEHYIYDGIDPECVLEVLNFADSHNIKNLLDYTLNYFVTHCKDTIKKGGWKNLAKKDPKSFGLIVDSLVEKL